MQPVFYIEKKKLPKCICIENKINEYLINEEFFGENFMNRYRESNITSGNNVENVVSNKTLKGSETEKNLYKKWLRTKEKKIVDSYKGRALEEIPEEDKYQPLVTLSLVAISSMALRTPVSTS